MTFQCYFMTIHYLMTIIQWLMSKPRWIVDTRNSQRVTRQIELIIQIIQWLMHYTFQMGPAISIWGRVRPSVGWSDGPSVRPSVTCFFHMPKMETFLHENHRGSPTSTLLNVLNILNVLNVLKMPKDPSLACWALFDWNSSNAIQEAITIGDIHWRFPMNSFTVMPIHLL